MSTTQFLVGALVVVAAIVVIGVVAAIYDRKHRSSDEAEDIATEVTLPESVTSFMTTSLTTQQETRDAVKAMDVKMGSISASVDKLQPQRQMASARGNY